jgi:DNA mismatch repair protein MSH5
MVPSKDSEYDEAQQIDDLGLTNQAGNLLKLLGQLDFEDRAGVGCVGALIAYLQKRRASEYLQHDPDAILAYRFTYIETVSVKNIMYVYGSCHSSNFD